MRSKQVDPIKFQFDIMQIPPISYFLSDQDVAALRDIATSLRLSAKIDVKRKMMDDIMRRRGFKRFQAGTNRIIYKFEESQAFVAKVAIDRVGMKDNPNEFRNQEILKPFVAKTFHVSECGTVALSERVEPIIRPSEFEMIAEDIYELITNRILGLYVMEDIGTKYFMNWGTRVGFGPVLLDYPYLFELDGDKLVCNVTDPITGIPCGGEIDYDAGFNELICKKCGKRYLARDLKRNIVENKVIMDTIIGGGKYPMIVQVKRGDEVISTSDSNSDTIVKPHMRKVKKNRLNKKEFDVVIANYRPQGQVTIKEEETEQKVEDNSKVIEISLDTSEPSKVEEPGFKTIITGGKPVKNDRDLNVKVVKGNVDQNKKTVVKTEEKTPAANKTKKVAVEDKKEEKNSDEDEESFRSSNEGKIEGSEQSGSDNSGRRDDCQIEGNGSDKSGRNEETQNNTAKQADRTGKRRNSQQVKMKYINKNKKLSAADQAINDKICSGEYYFDENGVLRKGDGSVYGGKKLRLKASDYTAAEDFPTKIDDEDY